MYSEDDLLSISALAHLEFCPRRCGLIHVEGEWSENAVTAEVPVIDHVPREGENMRVSFLHPSASNGALIELVMRKDVKRDS